MQKEEIFSYLEERFGLKRELFDGFEFLEESKGRVFMATKEAAYMAKVVTPVTLGLLFCRINGSIKISGNITQLFGKHATKSIVQLTEDQAKKFIEGEDLKIESPDCGNGYVIVKYKDYSLGVGLLKEGEIKNMLPKAKRIKIEI